MRLSHVIILMPFTVIKASKLPQSYGVKVPNCYAAISVDGGPVHQTECKTGINPEWGDSPFDLYVCRETQCPDLINHIFVLNSEVLDSSTFEIAIFRLSKRPFLKAEVIPMGRVSFSMGDISLGNQDMIGE